MEEKLEVKLIRKEVVKPSVPTPSHLSSFSLSLLDQIGDDIFVPVILFYSGNRNGGGAFSETCRHLKLSLSETLSRFYPFAGRIRDGFSVDCFDDGVQFVECKINCPITGTLVAPDHQDMIRQYLVPVDLNQPRKTEFLLVVQATLFECGGLAIAACFTHKIADAATFGIFLKGWVATTTKSGPLESPEMNLASVFPPSSSDHHQQEGGKLITAANNIVTRRLVFSASKLKELKRIASSEAVKQPTVVESVMGLIWKCAMKASSSSSSSSSSSRTLRSAAFVAMNLRTRLPHVIPKNTMGNPVGAALATTEVVITSNSCELITISKLVIALKKGEEAFNKRLEGVLRAPESILVIGMEAEVVEMESCFMFSSWCRLEGLYEADFGFGKPKWVTTINVLYKNAIVLMDTEDMQGVEALVTLGEKEMKLFRTDPQLLSFASLAPPISI